MPCIHFLKKVHHIIVKLYFFSYFLQFLHSPVTPYGENGTFLKSHQQEAALFDSSKTVGKPKMNFSHILFCVYDFTLALSDSLINVTQSCSLISFRFYIYFRNTIFDVIAAVCSVITCCYDRSYVVTVCLILRKKKLFSVKSNRTHFFYSR